MEKTQTDTETTFLQKLQAKQQVDFSKLTPKERKRLVKHNMRVLKKTRKACRGIAERLGVKNEDDVVELIKQYRREKHESENMV